MLPELRVKPHQTLVIVGHGIASHALCRALVEMPRAERPSIVAIGEEPRPAYNRVRLSERMAGVSADKLELAPRSWYDEQGIALHLGERACRIDRKSQQVLTDRGRRVGYDRLVLATGSYAWRPPVAGIHDAGCFVYRDMADVDALDAALAGARRAAVVGGGLLGLEAAKVLLDRGLHVTVVEAASGLLLRQLDLDSSRILERRLQRLGVELHVSTQIEAVERRTSGLMLKTPHSKLPAFDLVVVAAGVKPRDELASDAGLACGVRGGVIVDDLLTTSDPRIFAIGECVSHRGQTFGLAGPCRQMAQALGETLAGRPRAFEQPALDCRLKLVGVPVIAVGDYGNEHRMLAYERDGDRRTLILDGARLVGASAVGDWPELPSIERAVSRGETLSHRQLSRFERRGVVFGRSAPLPVNAWPAEMTVCQCAQVRAGELRACMETGVRELAQLSACTGAGQACGSCTPLLGQLLGDPALSSRRTRTFGLLGVSAAAVLAVLLTGALSPLPFADSVADVWRQLDRLWRETELKRITGFVTLALTALAFVITLRKRAHWPKRGDFNLYRSLHGAIGLATLLALVAHTGFRLGSNINFWLMTSFLTLNVVGAGVGVASSLEADPESPLAARARALRPFATLLHVVLLWPLPILLGLHVLATYYF